MDVARHGWVQECSWSIPVGRWVDKLQGHASLLCGSHCLFVEGPDHSTEGPANVSFITQNEKSVLCFTS